MIKIEDIQTEGLRVLTEAAAGKDKRGRPKALTAYQIVDRMDDAMVAELAKQGGIGGKGGGKPHGLAATQRVQRALKQLIKKGLVSVTYMDSRGLTFSVKDEPAVKASYPVTALYRYAGPLGNGIILI